MNTAAYIIIACVLSFLSGMFLTVGYYQSSRGKCKTYNVTATHQAVEICTKIANLK